MGGCTGLTAVLGVRRGFARGSAPAFVAPPSSAPSGAVEPKAAAKFKATSNLTSRSLLRTEESRRAPRSLSYPEKRGP